MNIYFTATFPMSHGSSGGVVVVAKYEGATKKLTTTPIQAYSGWWSHYQAMNKAETKAKTMAAYDAAVNGNRIHKETINTNAKAAAKEANLVLKTDQMAWYVG